MRKDCYLDESIGRCVVLIEGQIPRCDNFNFQLTFGNNQTQLDLTRRADLTLTVGISGRKDLTGAQFVTGPVDPIVGLTRREVAVANHRVTSAILRR